MNNDFYISKDTVPRIAPSFRRLLRRYLLVFCVNFIACTAITLFFTTRPDTGLNWNMADGLMPVPVIYALVLLFFRPLLKSMPYTLSMISNLSWAGIPFNFFLSTFSSAAFFRDLSYPLITVEKPGAVLRYPNERFFEIRDFSLHPDAVSVYHHQHTSGKYRKKLELADYYVVPMLDETYFSNRVPLTSIAYGVKMHASITRKTPEEKTQDRIESFYRQSQSAYKRYDFGAVGYFEKLKNTKDADHFAAAIRNNSGFDHASPPVILVNRTGNLYDLHLKNLKSLCLFLSAGLALGLLLLILTNRFSRIDSVPNK